MSCVYYCCKPRFLHGIGAFILKRYENQRYEYNSSLPFLPSYVNSISLEDTFHYVGKKVVWCSDNKFRECKAVKFNFEYEGHPYSELFFIDKSVEEDYAILGSIFWSKCDILK